MRLSGFRSSKGISLLLSFGVFGLVGLVLASYHPLAVAAQEEPIVPTLASDSEQQARDDFHAGLARRDRGEYEQAIRFFTRAIETKPDFALALATRALMYSNMNRPQQAIADAQKVSKIERMVAESYLARGIARYLLALLSPASRLPAPAPGSGFPSRPSVAPDAREDYERALRDISSAIKLEPENAQSYAMRGRVKVALADKSGALADCNKAIALSPTSNNYRIRAFVKCVARDYEGALRDYAKAIELNANSSNYYIRAIVRHQLRDHEGALQDFTKAIELEPSNGDWYGYRAGMKVALKDYQGALQDYAKAIELEPNQPGHYQGRALAKVRMDDLDGAVQDYSKAIELFDPEADAFGLALAYIRRGDLREKQSDLDGTIEDLKRALELNPQVQLRLGARLAVLQRKQLVAAGLAQPNTIVVAGDGSGDYTSISPALAGAIPGDIIAIRPGTYTLFWTSAEGVNLVGLGPDPAAVVIEGRGLFFLAGAKNVKLEHRTVDGISIRDSEDVTLENLHVVGKAVKRGWLGIRLEELTPHTKDLYGADRGAIVAQIDEGSPAADSELQVGDVIIGAAGEPVEDTGRLQQIIGSTPPHTTIELTVARNNKEQTVEVTLGEMPASTIRALGISVVGSQGVLIRSCQISGWYIGVDVAGASRVKLERNLIADNELGVLIIEGSKASLERNTIVGNTSDGKFIDSGCGVCVCRYGENTEAQLYNNIIAYNDVGILFDYNTRCEIGYNNAYGNLQVNYALFRYEREEHKKEGGWHYTSYRRDDISKSARIKGQFNLSVTPLFVDRFAGDYRLRADSPLINKGTGGSCMGAFPPAGLSLGEEEF